MNCYKNFLALNKKNCMQKAVLIIAGFIFLFFQKNNTLAQNVPADKHATQETINLYNNLKKNLDKGVMLGHQDDLAYGVELEI